MNDSTIQTLIDLNNRFYGQFASDFDDSRHAAWPGWLRLIPHLKSLDESKSPIRIVDLACGNARFWKFLTAELYRSFRYLGVDSCMGLLDCAPTAENSELIHHDVLMEGYPELACDFVGSFGFFHHIPSFERRRDILQKMVSHTELGGIIAVAFWAFAERPRFDSKVLPWPEELQREEGDYILTWNRGGLGTRYCHYVSEAEEAELIRGLPVEVVDRFSEDGKTHDLNRYLVLRRTEEA